MKHLYAAACLAAGAAMLSPAAAANAELPPAADRPVDYTADILPIFDQHCIDCHGAVRPKGGFRMDDAAAMMKGGVEGPAILPGDSAGSLLVLLLVGAHPDFDRMPPKGDPLSNDEIALVRAWIDQGAKMPEGDAPAADAPAEAPKADHPATAEVPGVAGWKIEATDQQGPLAAWERMTTLQGPNGESVLGLTRVNDPHPGTFNLCWTADRAVQDGTFLTKVQALGGDHDQGGGIAWRVKDKDNYYVARYNPLEENLRAYKVVGGKREQLAGADLPFPGEWLALRVEARGNTGTVSVNGRQVLQFEDAALPDAGGYGFWTKGDASTAFTSMVVTQP